MTGAFRASGEGTEGRAGGRAGGFLVDPQPIRSLYRRFTGIGDIERHVLDSTHLTARETADR